MNIGHDDAEVVVGFKKIMELFDKDRVAKSFMITDFGILERYFLSSLQNMDEQVMLYSCRCLQKLLSGKGGTGSYNEGTQELLIKR